MNAFALRDDLSSTRETQPIPGEHLRAVRQAGGFTQANIANRLHLSVATVEALENGDYTHLPGPVFIRGYLRNYARVLGVDENALLSNYQPPSPPQEIAPSPPTLNRNGIRPEISSSHTGVRIVTWVLVCGLLILLAMWWQGRLGWEDTLLEPPAISTSNDTSNSSELHTGEGTSLPPPGKDLIPPSEPTNTASETPAPTASPVVPVTSPTEPAATSAPPPPQVVVEFVAPAWIQIKDATGATLLSGRQHKGVKRLTGSPPYAITLGNRQKIRITVNDQPFPITAPKRGTLIRFTLDPSKLTTP